MRIAKSNHVHTIRIEPLENRLLYSAATETAAAGVALTSTTGKAAHTRYAYDITLTDTSTTPIGTFWFAWTPGQDYLATSPTSVSDPAGWTHTITGGGTNNGFAIEWTAKSTGIAAGKSLAGFKFISADAPSIVGGNSPFYSTTPVETSTVYSGAAFSDSGFQFIATVPAVVPKNSFLAKLPTTPTITASTVPANGDVNPYGVGVVPDGFAKGGTIAAGDVLVSNFNDAAGLQGTGTTIVSISPSGAASTFYQGPTGLGLTNALGVLRDGFVLVGNVPAPDGANVTGPGSLQVLDKNGTVVDTLTDSNLLDGPWDLAVEDSGNRATVFVSNVLNGTVTRLRLAVSPKTDSVTTLSETEIASGYAFRTDPAALVVGPTGLALSPNGTLYVASTGDNAIYAIPGAAIRRTPVVLGRLVYQDSTHLRGPLALAFVGNNLVAANGDAVNPDSTGRTNSELVEFTPSGKFVNQFQVDSTIGGAFGLAFAKIHGKSVFAAIDDVTNSLDEWNNF